MGTSLMAERRAGRPKLELWVVYVMQASVLRGPVFSRVSLLGESAPRYSSRRRKFRSTAKVVALC